MDELIAQIKDLCLDGEKTAYSRLKKIFLLLGGDAGEFVKAHEKPPTDELTEKKRVLRENLLRGYVSLTGTEMPCGNWPKWAKTLEKAAGVLTMEQIGKINETFLKAVDKKKKGISLTFDDKYIISHYTAEGLAYHTAEVLKLCVSPPKEKASFHGGQL